VSVKLPPLDTAMPAEPDVARVLAPFGRRLLAVTGMRELGAYRVLHVADPEGAGGRAPDPGQFAMLAATERWGAGEDERPYLPRAFSYARWRDGEAQFLLEDVGPGTHRLCELGEGDGLWLLGPLGQGFTAPRHGRRALLVGGGVGIAPLAIWQDRLQGVGMRDQPAAPPAGGSLAGQATVLLGFRDRAHAEGAALLSGALLASEDGSVGREALVTDLLREELDRDAHATVYACGPPAMLEAVRALCAERAVPAQLALEAGMACGFGACFGCVVPTRAGTYARVCVDGPVFVAGLLSRVEAHPGTGA
jgi:dihydroorotate dehydrogenase electron transfer subunit